MNQKWFNKIYYGNEEGKSPYQEKWSFLTHIENISVLLALIALIWYGVHENISILKDLFTHLFIQGM